ncbi:MAG: hypothetical protein RIT04_689 [Candidatus Parcubacteria bacterium]|jgi:DNA-directed RNA polymerase subunit RPC12/RpoP
MKNTCVCPECKNQVDLTRYSDIKEGVVIECNFCGITLEVVNVLDGNVVTEIVDEGK